MSKLTELIWYEMGDGLNATDVTECAESIKRLVLEQVAELNSSDWSKPINSDQLRQRVETL